MDSASPAVVRTVEWDSLADTIGATTLFRSFTSLTGKPTLAGKFAGRRAASLPPNAACGRGDISPDGG
jgi:hypothetical protein